MGHTFDQNEIPVWVKLVARMSVMCSVILCDILGDPLIDLLDDLLGDRLVVSWVVFRMAGLSSVL